MLFSGIERQLVARVAVTSTQIIKRNHWVFSHVYLPERTPDGKPQRRPSDHPDFMKYVACRQTEFDRAAPPIKVILMEEITDLGDKYDVVEVSPKIAHNTLLPFKKAVYASPFDLEYYAQKKKEIQAELDRKIRIPVELLNYARIFMDQIVPLVVSADNEWTLNREIIVNSLHQKDIQVTDASIIHLSNKVISGPDPNIEAMFIRFYITLDDQMIVPMLGRIKHFSENQANENLYPSTKQQLNRPKAEQLKEYGLLPEKLYYNPNGLKEAMECECGIEEFMAKQYREQEERERVHENERENKREKI